MQDPLNPSRQIHLNTILAPWRATHLDDKVTLLKRLNEGSMSWEGFKVALNKCRNKIVLIQALIAYYVKEDVIKVDDRDEEGKEKIPTVIAGEEEDKFYVSKK